MKKNFWLLLLPVLFSGCIMDYYYGRPLSVVNSSSDRVAVEIANDTAKQVENTIKYYPSNEIVPNDTAFVKKPGENAWQEYLEESPTKTLYVYVYNVDTLNKYQSSSDMNYLRANKKYVKRLTYTADKLKQANWVIVFK